MLGEGEWAGAYTAVGNAEPGTPASNLPSRTSLMVSYTAKSTFYHTGQDCSRSQVVLIRVNADGIETIVRSADYAKPVPPAA